MRLRRLREDEGTNGELAPDLVAKLSAKRPDERARAEEAIARLGPNAVDALMAVLRREAGKRKRKRRILAAVVSYMLIMTTIIIVSGKVEMIGSVTSLSSVIATLAAISQVQKNAARKLTEFDDPRTVGFLAEALHFQDKALREAAAGRLAALLPKLKASDAGLMSDEQRLCLYKAIVLPSPRIACDADWALLRAALPALEQIGDERALPYVDAIIDRTPRNAAESEIVDLARQCRPALAERIEQQRVAMTLLRPSEAPSEGADILLRPAMGVGQTDPDLLLRPSEPASDA